ncbi:MAG: SCO family protein [Chloroflexi bacterium]|nr:SCO family protein [Chloroflexota bacterium]
MKYTIALLACLIGALLFDGCASKPYTFHGTQLQPPMTFADFALTNQDNHTTRLSDYRGNWLLIYFGYTHCPDECPLTLAQFKKIHDDLKTDAARAHFVFVTVDPVRDTPEQMKVYLGQFDPSFIGLTGTPATLNLMYRKYGVAAEANADGTPKVDHTNAMYLFDDQGQLSFIYTGIPWQDIAADLRVLLKKKV